MSFNPDPKIQVQEVIFSCKLQARCHPPLLSNDIPVNQGTTQKNLEMILDLKLSFEEHWKSILTKVKPDYWTIM